MIQIKVDQNTKLSLSERHRYCYCPSSLNPRLGSRAYVAPISIVPRTRADRFTANLLGTAIW